MTRAQPSCGLSLFLNFSVVAAHVTSVACCPVGNASSHSLWPQKSHDRAAFLWYICSIGVAVLHTVRYCHCREENGNQPEQIGRILGFHSDGYEECRLLGCDAV
jgi:hypothetical protein